MKLRFCDVDGFEFLVGDVNTFWIEVGIQLCTDAQSILGGSAANEVDDDFMTYQWLASPIHADKAKHSVFDLVPFARAWREMAHRNT